MPQPPINPQVPGYFTRVNNPLSPGLPQNLFPNQSLPFSPQTFRPYGGLPPATAEQIAATIAAQIATTQAVEQGMGSSTGRVPPPQPLAQPPSLAGQGPNLGGVPTAQAAPGGPAIGIQIVEPTVTLPQAGMQTRPYTAYFPQVPPTSQLALVIEALKALVVGEVVPASIYLLLAKHLYNVDIGLTPTGSLGEFLEFPPSDLAKYSLSQLEALADQLARIEASKLRIPNILDWKDP